MDFACDSTVVCDLKRSTSERTKGRIAAEVTSTGASPAACSNRRLHDSALNSCGSKAVLSLSTVTAISDG
jgi:hypothetical protein